MDEQRKFVIGDTGTSDEPAPTPPKPKRRARRIVFGILGGFALLIVLAAALVAVPAALYHGPRTLERVTAVMPGVPIFPVSTLAAGNARTQHTMALPLLLARMQGAKHAEAALLQAPADPAFMLYWYRETAPTQDWRLVAQEDLENGTRLVFTRNREVLQLIVGLPGEISTPVQYIYLGGLTDEQLAELPVPGATTIPPAQAPALPAGAKIEGMEKPKVPPIAKPASPTGAPTGVLPQPSAPPGTVVPWGNSGPTPSQDGEEKKASSGRTGNRQRSAPRPSTTSPQPKATDGKESGRRRGNQ